MIFRKHLKFTLTIIIVLRKFGGIEAINLGDWWHIITASTLANLLPDLDHPGSWGARWFPRLSKFIVKISGHRGFTHSAAAILTVSVSVLTLSLLSEDFVPTDVVYSAVIGYLSHVLADMFSPSGVPLLWPCNLKFRIPSTLRGRVKDSIGRSLNFHPFWIAVVLLFF